jgi:hypothetical protein
MTAPSDQDSAKHEQPDDPDSRAPDGRSQYQNFGVFEDRHNSSAGIRLAYGLNERRSTVISIFRDLEIPSPSARRPFQKGIDSFVNTT